MSQTHLAGARLRTFRVRRRAGIIRSALETTAFALAFGFMVALVFGLVP